MTTARELAYKLLIKTEKSRQFSNIALDNALNECSLSEADKRLTSVIFYGVTERRITLDYIISNISSRKIQDIDISVLTAIRIGLFQLIYLDKIPVHAAINESVKLCTKKTSGFANAILREYTRQNSPIFPDKSDFPFYLSVKYSVSLPLAEKFINTFGNEAAEDILRGFESKSNTTLRINTLRANADDLIDKIPSAEKSNLIDTALFTSGSVRELYGFDDGLFFVQDVASQIAVRVLDAKPFEAVLDICSCPGSKSFGAAIDMKNQGSIIAFDIHENKLSLVSLGAKRLGIDIIQTRAHDGRNFIPELSKSADRIICDVPCSGFGVLAKKPELRYKNPADCASLPKIQRDILNTASKYLKHGGTLIYSTCTLLPDENEENIKSFLADNEDFYLEAFDVNSISAPEGMLTLYPHIHGTDGFFIAKLKRK